MKDDKQDWVKVYAVDKEHIASLIQLMLAEHDIACIIMNKQDSFYFFGEIELYVHREEVVRALHLIEKHSV